MDGGGVVLLTYTWQRRSRSGSTTASDSDTVVAGGTQVTNVETNLGVEDVSCGTFV